MEKFMKTIVLTGVAVLALSGVFAQTPWHLDPTVVSVGKELPRGEVVSHDSKVDAVLRTSGASRYLQPLENWTRTETADAVSFTTRFKIPFDWLDRRQFLYVGRASGSFSVAVNDSIVAYSQTGSTPSEFDITPVALEGANSLKITIFKASVARHLSGRRATEPCFEGDVYILSQPRVRVRDVAIATRMEGTEGFLQLGVILKSHQLNPHDYIVHWELLNPVGEIVAEGRKGARLDMRREDTVHFFALVPRIVPWSHEEPRLYTLFIKTQNEGRFREYLAFRVGFRGVDFSGSDFRDGVGNVRVVREVSPTREFLARCDSMGVYVVCGADIDTRSAGESRRVGGNPSNNPAWGGSYLDRTLAMYHTSKNHPSVAMFSLAERSANGLNLYDSYLALKQLEHLRPVVYTDGGGEWNTDLQSLDEVSPTPTPGSRSLPPASADGSGPNQRSGFSPTAPGWLKLEPIDLPEVVGTTAPVARFRLTNSRKITPFAGEAIFRIVTGRRKVVSSGTVAVEALPGGSTEFSIPVAGVKPGKTYTVSLEIAVERADGDYLPAGDPNLRVYRRLDLPLRPEARATVARGEFRRE
jgi:beta-galactosidase